METNPLFHHEFLLEERRAILQRWVADQMEGRAAAAWATCNPVPLVGYSSEFFDRFLDDLADHVGERAREWLQGVIAESVMDEITSSSLAYFFITLRRAISSLWSMGGHGGAGGGSTLSGAGCGEATEVIEALAALDTLLLDGLTMLEQRRAHDPSHDIDSLEFLREVAHRTEMDSIDILDSVEVVPPEPCRAGLRNMAGHLRSFLTRDANGMPLDCEKPTGAYPGDPGIPMTAVECTSGEHSTRDDVID